MRSPGSKIGETIYDSATFDGGGNEAFPWSIWVANANNGNASKVWSARKGMGDEFYPTMSAAQLWWLKGNEIAFPWEGDGWQHIYAVSANGGEAKRLTTGGYDVETVAPGTKLLLASNEGDLDVRHIWSVGLDGTPKQLTSGSENQWYPTPLTNDGLAYI